MNKLVKKSDIKLEARYECGLKKIPIDRENSSVKKSIKNWSLGSKVECMELFNKLMNILY